MAITTGSRKGELLRLKWSDIDLCIIVEESSEKQVERIRNGLRELKGIHFPVDILVFTIEEINILEVAKIPHIQFEDKMPSEISFKVFKELEYNIIEIGSLSKNYQILITFCKQFDKYFLIRMFEFKLFNKDYEKPNFISGGVYLYVTDEEFKIEKQF